VGELGKKIETKKKKKGIVRYLKKPVKHDGVR
jgi:hypothetical protein